MTGNEDITNESQQNEEEKGRDGVTVTLEPFYRHAYIHGSMNGRDK